MSSYQFKVIKWDYAPVVAKQPEVTEARINVYLNEMDSLGWKLSSFTVVGGGLTHYHILHER